MGTRADFYIGRGEQAEWIGSIAWDGHPGSIADDVLGAMTEETFRAAVAAFFAERDDTTLPDRGWPWPWEDSRTTDYAYAFGGDGVYYSHFGLGWHAHADGPAPDDWPGEKTATFPNMKERQNIRWDRGSGVILVGPKGPI